ncbi:MAG: hypothetical protein ACRDLB_00230 [Actinomycetota bacterium]
MGDRELTGLEAAIKALPGVLGCVILLNRDATAAEIQVFTQMGIVVADVEQAINREVETSDSGLEVRGIHVFELEAEALPGDRASLEEAARLAEEEARARSSFGDLVGPEPRGRPGSGLRSRPVLQRVVLSASDIESEAEVALDAQEDRQVVGVASGEKTAYSLKVVAEAALQACAQLVEGFETDLRGASLVTLAGEEVAMVLLKHSGGPDLVGAALLRQGSPAEAVVRATLDAVNRQLLRWN